MYCILEIGTGLDPARDFTGFHPGIPDFEQKTGFAWLIPRDPDPYKTLKKILLRDPGNAILLISIVYC